MPALLGRLHISEVARGKPSSPSPPPPIHILNNPPTHPPTNEQLVVRRNPSPDPRFQPETVTSSLVSYDFKPGARALFLGRSHYGCVATILPDASAGLTKKVWRSRVMGVVGG